MSQPTFEQIAKILDGIDRDESDDKPGWWPTSSGANFGKRKLVEIKAIFGSEKQVARDKRDKQYLAAIRITTVGGQIVEGNKPFFTNEPLALAHLEKVKELYLEEAREKGFVSDAAVILAVIPLEA